MKKIIDLIERNINKEKITFVFPSEIVTNFWRKHTLSFTGKRILDLGKFISWDNFKTETILYPGNRAPVNNQDRTLFLNQLLEENKKDPQLNSIIPKNYAEHSSSFSRKLTEILPTLHTLPQSLERLKKGEKLKDFYYLKEQYIQFLEEQELFEPNFETPDVSSGGKKYILFFPEVVKDFAFLAPLIRKDAGINIITQEEALSPELYVFDNSLQELDFLLTDLEKLLNGGITPDKIAITLCRPEEIEEHLEKEAALRDIPLYLHKGNPLSSYRELYFLKQLRECHTARFSFEAVKNLLLNQAVPWKNPGVIKELIRFGIEFKCLKNHPGEDDENRDNWLQGFRKAGKTGALGRDYSRGIKPFYEELRKSILQLNKAVTLGAMKRELYRWMDRFLNLELWAEAPYTTFKFALTNLDELISSAEQLKNVRIPHPFSLWLNYMEDSNYVKETHSNKIPVYNYRVSAGINPEYHFILNTSQRGTHFVTANYPYLNVYEQEKMDMPETDLTASYLNLYTHSGKEVHFSFSRKSFTETNIIPGFFISSGRIREMDDQPGGWPYRKERLFWENPPAFPRPGLLPLQRESFLQAEKTVNSIKGKDYTRDPVDNKALLNYIRENIKKEEKINISPTSLEQYLVCPFKFMLRQGVKIEEEEFTPGMIDRRVFGSSMHHIFRTFYGRIKKEGAQILRPEKESFYLEVMDQSSQLVLKDYEESKPVPFSLYWDWLKERMEDYARDFVREELKSFSEFDLVSTETVYEHPFKPDAALKGQIDRVSVKEGFMVLVDYKKKSHPQKGDIFREDSLSIQLPFYVYLYELSQGETVEAAAYYSIEEKKYTCIFSSREEDKKSGTREEMDLAIENLKALLETFYSALCEGNFTIPRDLPSDKRCGGCSYRAICRRRFIVP